MIIIKVIVVTLAIRVGKSASRFWHGAFWVAACWFSMRDMRFLQGFDVSFRGQGEASQCNT